MQVQQILRDKGGDGVITVPPQTSVATVVTQLCCTEVGSWKMCAETSAFMKS